MTDNTITRWCTDGKHVQCSGIIRAGTGWNWWCTCTCHPEPTVEPGRADFQQAFDFWKRHRAESVTS